MKEVQAEAKALVEEIAHNMAVPAVRTLAFVLRNALRRVLHGVYVNTAGLEKVGTSNFLEPPLVTAPLFITYKIFFSSVRCFVIIFTAWFFN